MNDTRLVERSRRDGDYYLFDAVLRPNTSLGRRGFVILMSAIGVTSFGVGLAFTLMGAWPIMGFFGLDVAFLYLLFRWNYRWARMHEIVQLSERALTVERVVPSGASTRWRFQPSWLRVECRTLSAHRTELVLSSHGRSLTIGAFLTPGERQELARALNDALVRLRGSGRLSHAG